MMGVGTVNVEKVVPTISSKFARAERVRLPREKFSCYMFLETRRLAQILVAENILP